MVPGKLAGRYFGNDYNSIESFWKRNQETGIHHHSDGISSVDRLNISSSTDTQMVGFSPGSIHGSAHAVQVQQAQQQPISRNLFGPSSPGRNRSLVCNQLHSGTWRLSLQPARRNESYASGSGTAGGGIMGYESVSIFLFLFSADSTATYSRNVWNHLQRLKVINHVYSAVRHWFYW